MSNPNLKISWLLRDKTIITMLNPLLASETFADVTFSVEGKCIRAHKIILAACSGHFLELFRVDKERNPIIYMGEAKYNHVKAIIDHMYLGEFTISAAELPVFLNLAHNLRIRGLERNRILQEYEKYEKNSSNTVSTLTNELVFPPSEAIPTPAPLPVQTQLPTSFLQLHNTLPAPPLPVETILPPVPAEAGQVPCEILQTLPVPPIISASSEPPIVPFSSEPPPITLPSVPSIIPSPLSPPVEAINPLPSMSPIAPQPPLPITLHSPRAGFESTEIPLGSSVAPLDFLECENEQILPFPSNESLGEPAQDVEPDSDIPLLFYNELLESSDYVDYLVGSINKCLDKSQKGNEGEDVAKAVTSSAGEWIVDDFLNILNQIDFASVPDADDLEEGEIRDDTEVPDSMNPENIENPTLVSPSICGGFKVTDNTEEVPVCQKQDIKAQNLQKTTLTITSNKEPNEASQKVPIRSSPRFAKSKRGTHFKSHRVLPVKEAVAARDNWKRIGRRSIQPVIPDTTNKLLAANNTMEKVVAKSSENSYQPLSQTIKLIPSKIEEMENSIKRNSLCGLTPQKSELDASTSDSSRPDSSRLVSTVNLINSRKQHESISRDKKQYSSKISSRSEPRKVYECLPKENSTKNEIKANQPRSRDSKPRNKLETASQEKKAGAGGTTKSPNKSNKSHLSGRSSEKSNTVADANSPRLSKSKRRSPRKLQERKQEIESKQTFTNEKADSVVKPSTPLEDFDVFTANKIEDDILTLKLPNPAEELFEEKDYSEATQSADNQSEEPSTFNIIVNPIFGNTSPEDSQGSLLQSKVNDVEDNMANGKCVPIGTLEGLKNAIPWALSFLRIAQVLSKTSEQEKPITSQNSRAKLIHRKSFSTPRKSKNHVRSLLFTTPPGVTSACETRGETFPATKKRKLLSPFRHDLKTRKRLEWGFTDVSALSPILERVQDNGQNLSENVQELNKKIQYLGVGSESTDVETTQWVPTTPRLISPNDIVPGWDSPFSISKNSPMKFQSPKLDLYQMSPLSPGKCPTTPGRWLYPKSAEKNPSGFVLSTEALHTPINCVAASHTDVQVEQANVVNTVTAENSLLLNLIPLQVVNPLPTGSVDKMTTNCNSGQERMPPEKSLANNTSKVITPKHSNLIIPFTASSWNLIDPRLLPSKRPRRQASEVKLLKWVDVTVPSRQIECNDMHPAAEELDKRKLSVGTVHGRNVVKVNSDNGQLIEISCNKAQVDEVAAQKFKLPELTESKYRDTETKSGKRKLADDDMDIGGKAEFTPHKSSTDEVKSDKTKSSELKSSIAKKAESTSIEANLVQPGLNKGEMTIIKPKEAVIVAKSGRKLSETKLETTREGNWEKSKILEVDSDKSKRNSFNSRIRNAEFSNRSMRSALQSPVVNPLVQASALQSPVVNSLVQASRRLSNSSGTPKAFPLNSGSQTLSSTIRKDGVSFTQAVHKHAGVPDLLPMFQHTSGNRARELSRSTEFTSGLNIGKRSPSKYERRPSYVAEIRKTPNILPAKTELITQSRNGDGIRLSPLIYTFEEHCKMLFAKLEN